TLPPTPQTTHKTPTPPAHQRTQQPPHQRTLRTDARHTARINQRRELEIIVRASSGDPLDIIVRGFSGDPNAIRSTRTGCAYLAPVDGNRRGFAVRDRRHVATIATGQAHYRARRCVNAKRAR